MPTFAADKKITLGFAHRPPSPANTVSIKTAGKPVSIKFPDAQQKQGKPDQGIRSYIAQTLIISLAPVCDSRFGTRSSRKPKAKDPVILTDRNIDTKGSVALRHDDRLRLHGRRPEGRLSGCSTTTRSRAM